MSFIRSLTGYRNASFEECIQAVAEGKLAAVDALFVQLKPLLDQRARFFRFGLDDGQRDDLTQKAALWLYEDIQRYCQRYDAKKGTPIGYFQHVIRLLFLRAYRPYKAGSSREQVPYEEAMGGEFAADPGPDAVLEGQRLETLVADFRSRLSSSDQQILDQRILGALPSQEVGEQLGMQPSAIDKRVSRLRKLLLELLEKAGHLPMAVTLLLGLIQLVLGNIRL